MIFPWHVYVNWIQEVDTKNQGICVLVVAPTSLLNDSGHGLNLNGGGLWFQASSTYITHYMDNGYGPEPDPFN